MRHLMIWMFHSMLSKYFGPLCVGLFILGLFSRLILMLMSKRVSLQNQSGKVLNFPTNQSNRPQQLIVRFNYLLPTLFWTLGYFAFLGAISIGFNQLSLAQIDTRTISIDQWGKFFAQISFSFRLLLLGGVVGMIQKVLMLLMPLNELNQAHKSKNLQDNFKQAS